jgi:opacity protein-like surface antigen
MRSLALVLTLMTPTLAHAQSVAEARTWTATPFLGVSFGTSGDLDSSLGLGAAVGYDITSNLGVEAELGRVFDIVSDTDFIDWSLTTFSVNAVYHFDVLRVTPYATAGLGLERSAIDVDVVAAAATVTAAAVIDSTTNTEVAFNFGGGIKYKISDNMLARADLRRFQANDSAPDHWRLYGGITFMLRR